MTAWGVPDWRDAGAYPPEMPMHEWRWQFCRRRPDYRAFWTEHEAADLARSVAFAEHMRTNGDPDYPMPAERPGRMLKASFFDGTSQTLDPRCPRYMPGIFEGDGGGATVMMYDPEYDLRRDAGDKMLVEFDLAKPLGPQLDRAGRTLAREQAEHAGRVLPADRFHVSKWAVYLRVIDARDAGASWREIGAEVLMHVRDEPQAARQTWEAAREVMFKVGR